MNAGPHRAMGIRSPEGGVIEACELPEVDAGNENHWKKSKCCYLLIDFSSPLNRNLC